MSMFNQPPKEPTNGDQIAIDRSDGLTSVTPKVIAEVGNIPGGDPTDDEPLTIGGNEPLGELSHVQDEAPPRAWCKIVCVQILLEQVSLDFANRDAFENIYRRILHALYLQI
jgi:hypothetical protein